jgi:hypothetical protein
MTARRTAPRPTPTVPCEECGGECIRDPVSYAHGSLRIHFCCEDCMIVFIRRVRREPRIPLVIDARPPLES